MGRHDFRPLRVRQTAQQYLSVEKNARPPPWYSVVGTVTPSQALVRTQPVDHSYHLADPRHKQFSQKQRRRRPSKMFQPTSIHYEEDALRREFFGDHPWELARPRMVIEDGGRDWQTDDWSRIRQKARGLSGESVIQRQLHLLHTRPNLSLSSAYDIARKEFYALRLKQDVERRVAQEEAASTGAYFGKTPLEIGQELEDKQFEEWKVWAGKEAVAMEQRKASMYSGNDSQERALEEDEPETEAAEEMVGEDMPAQGQEAYGGAKIHA